MKRTVSLLLLLFLSLSLSLAGLAEWFEAVPPTAENIDEAQALAIAMEQMADMPMGQISDIPLKDYDNFCRHLKSSGVPSSIWRVSFFTRELADDVRLYEFTLDSITGEVVTSGWTKRHWDGWDKPGYETQDREKEALARAEAEVCAFYGLDVEELLSKYSPDVSEGAYDGVACYQIYWLPKDASVQNDHYYVQVSIEMGTVVEVLHSSMSFG